MPSYGEIVEHPHPAINAYYTYVAPVGQEGYHLFSDLQRLTGADGGSLDFGEGLGFWLRGAWSLPHRDDIEEPEEFILAVVSAEDTQRLLDDYLKGECDE